MGNGFLGIQEGWTDVAEWDYHFDGSLRFDAEDQVSSTPAIPAPSDHQNPQLSLSVVIWDALYADIQEIFEEYGIFYNVTDILGVYSGYSKRNAKCYCRRYWGSLVPDYFGVLAMD